MAEAYSVKAVLSAADRGFTSAIKGAGSAVDALGSKLKSGLGFGILTGIGQKAFDSISSGIGGLISDMNEASAAWKTFQGNMSMNGHSAKEIKKTKSVLQDYATKTIYSASDMATTFAQLDAVGIKSAQDLVTGFGGLAAAAENPQQAMKTLSQQATQMAAKPSAQWQDFKLMLEQTPAGIAAIAKAMGMSTAELVKQVQAGTVKTEDFFNAIKEVGNNDDFSKLATQYKTVGQAMDGLKETLSNKLAPAFNAVSDMGIQAISSITDALDGIDGDAIAGKIKDLVATVKPYWTIIKTDVGIVKDAFEEAFSAIGKALGKLNGSFGSDENVSGFSKTLGTVTQAVTKFAGFLEEHADTIAKVIKAVTDHLPQLLGAFLALKGAQKAASGVKAVSGVFRAMASGPLGSLAGKLFGVSKGTKKAGKSSRRSAKNLMASAKSFVLMGVGIQAISSITDALDGIDGDAIAGKIKDLVATVKPYWTIIKTDVGIVKDAFEEAFSAIGKALGKLNGSFGSDENVSGFSKTLGTVTQAVTKFAGFLEEHADTIAKVIKAVTDHLPQLLGAFLALKGAQKAASGVKAVSGVFRAMASGPLGSLAGKLFGVSKGTKKAGKSSRRSAKNLMASAKSFVLMGVGILAISAGFALLAKSAIELAKAGPAATGIMAVLVGAVAGLSVGMTAMAKSLTKASPKKLAAVSKTMLSVAGAVAAIALSLAVLALALTPLASLGTTAVAPLIAFGAVVAGLTVVFANMGTKLQSSVVGIVAFAAAVSVMALAMTPLASTGTEGAIAMGAFGLVVAGLVAMFAVFGPALNAAIPGMLGLAAAAVGVGAGMRLATPFIEAMPPLVKQIGDTASQVAGAVASAVERIAGAFGGLVIAIANAVSQIVDAIGTTLCNVMETAAESIDTALGAIGDCFTALGDGVATVIDSISSGISDVLDSVAGVIESIGNSARNAGEGFQLFADGVSTIVGLPLVDTAASLAAVATGIGEIALAGSGVGEVGEGMRGVATALQMILQGQGAIAQLVTISQMAPVAASNLNAMAAALGNFGPAAAGTAAAAAAILVLVSAASRAGGASLAMAGGLRASGAAARGLSGGLTASASGLRVVASAGNSAVKSVKGIQDAAKGTASALLPIGAAAKSAASALIKSLTSAAAAAKAAGLAIGKGVSQSIQRGFAPLPKLAQSAMNSVASSVQSGGTKAAASAQRAASAIVKAFQQAVPRATAAGGYIGKGLANGMASTLSQVRSVAAQLAAAADAAIRAKAKIASPSKVAHKSGAFIGAGLANGMLSKVNAVTAAAKKLAASALKQLRAKASSSGGNYKSLGEKLSKGYKTSLTKSLNKALKAAKKLIQKRTGKALTGKLYTALSKAMKSGASKAISTAQKAITRVSTAAQEKYDAAIQRRDSFYEKLADMGDIYTVDSYGYLSLKDFDAGTKQINALGKNLNKLKSKLPQGLLNEIADMETANGLAYTNRLLKMSAEELKAYGNSYTKYVGAAEKTSSAFCKSQLSAIRKEFNSSVTRELKSLNARLTAVGKDAMAGFVKGMNSVTKKLKGSSKRLALSVVSVFRKYLKIHSPSRVFAQLGRYVGQGFADGMESTGRMIQRVAAEVISIPAAAPVPVLAGGGKLPADCDYYGSGEYTVIVPVELDGREVARVTAPYTQKELNKLQTRDNRKRGRAGR